MEAGYKQRFYKWFLTDYVINNKVDICQIPIETGDNNKISINVVWDEIVYGDDFEEKLLHFFKNRPNDRWKEVYLTFRPDKLYIF